jgi:hypothetical protein
MGTGGGSAVTFAQVKTIFAASCGTGDCHNAASNQLNYQTGNLYMLLTTAIANTAANKMHCVGTTPVKTGDAAGSLLVAILKGQTTCNTSNNKTEMIGPMPDDCPSKRPCLTNADIKTISDWITGGAPM